MDKAMQGKGQQIKANDRGIKKANVQGENMVYCTKKNCGWNW